MAILINDAYIIDRCIQAQTLLMIRLAITCLPGCFDSNRMAISINGQIQEYFMLFVHIFDDHGRN